MNEILFQRLHKSSEERKLTGRYRWHARYYYSVWQNGPPT